MKILYIDSWDNVGDFFREQRQKNHNLDNYGLYANNGLFNKLIRFLGLKIYKPLLYFSYGNWKNSIEKYDIFIIESRKSFEYVINLINRKCPGKRVIVWYWNEITKREMNPVIIRKKYFCETWTFDLNDSKKYNMRYNNTYYFNSITDNVSKSADLTNDLFYIGIDREGRIDTLNSIANICNKLKIKYCFKLAKSPIRKAQLNYKYSDRLEYKEVLNYIIKSKAILDLTKKSQYGLTLRPMESIFLKKKLITDNKNIQKYDFYNKNNVFLIGVDDYDNLKKFIDSDFMEIPYDIVKYYSFDSWLKRIIEDDN